MSSLATEFGEEPFWYCSWKVFGNICLYVCMYAGGTLSLQQRQQLWLLINRF